MQGLFQSHVAQGEREPNQEERTEAPARRHRELPAHVRAGRHSGDAQSSWRWAASCDDCGNARCATSVRGFSPGSLDRTVAAHALAQQPSDTTYELDGYTDDTGSARENEQLSLRRAKAAADRLTQDGSAPRP